jgi:hypothetical protein
MKNVMWFPLFASFTCNAEYIPFGISMGYPPNKLAQCVTKPGAVGTSSCTTIDVPDKDSRFSEYQFIYTENAGVCVVQAFNTFDTRQETSQIRKAYEGFRTDLTKSLGPPQATTGSMDDVYWKSAKEHFEANKSKFQTIGTVSWEKSKDSNFSPTISKASLRTIAQGAEKAQLIFSVQFDNYWRCFQPDVSPHAKTVVHTAADLGLATLGSGTAKLTQTEIAPQVYWLQRVDVKPAVGQSIGYSQFDSLLALCTIWRGEKALGQPFWFKPRIRRLSSGDLVAFLPEGRSKTSIEEATGGSLQEITQMKKVCLTAADQPK